MGIQRLNCILGVLVAALNADRLVHAEPAGEIMLPPGFRAELVYTVPLETQGSWVSMTIDDKGRLLAGDQNGGIFRIEPSPLGADAARTKVEPLNVSVGMAQGLLFHKGQLYVMQNGRVGNFSTGLYRLKDSNNDDQFDHMEQLRVFEKEGEHGPHAVVLGPDGKHLYLCAGNFTRLPLYVRSLVPPRWGEDQVLPRISDPRGHGVQVTAPCGWIARTNLDGDNLEVVSIGYRNMYDIAFNADGELFTFDSDMEWDIGTPWYRPTRVCHVTSGSDFGFRAGNGVWPAYFIDTLPTVIDAGPGSPTGLTFGGGTKFPPKYQQALFAGDWSYGNIFAFHIHPEGASYRGEMERFASAMPLGVTDMVVRPQDGALYFCVGGRNSESALYRIVWTGAGAAQALVAATPAIPPNAGASTTPITGPVTTPPALSPSESRTVRRTLEAYHAPISTNVIEKIWAQLSNPDRFISSAARVALEHQPISQWREQALAEPNADARILALVALARVADRAQQADWAKAITSLNFVELDVDQRQNLLRAAALGVIRFDPLEPSVREQLVQTLNPQFPTNHSEVDRELSHLLVRLRAPNLIERMLTQLEIGATQEERLDLAMTLAAVHEGWTLESRRRLLTWFDNATRMTGGMSFFGYMAAARQRFIAMMGAEDSAALADLVSKPFVEQAAQIQTEARPVVREWKLDELVELIERDKSPRDFQSGRKMFSAAGCYNCHRVAGAGSTIGPDLSGVSGRFGVRDLLRSIVEPSQTISDQYQQMAFETNGRIIVGRVTNLSAQEIMVNTDMLDPKKTETILRSELDDQYPSDVSMMPSGLLNTLKAEEILDLVAFLRSGGRPDSQLFTAAAGGQ
jgi:putative heme-binding domain-containing protein